MEAVAISYTLFYTIILYFLRPSRLNIIFFLPILGWNILVDTLDYSEWNFCFRINLEGGIRGVWKPQNRTEIRQKTANRIGFFPEYRNRTYMEATIWKLTSARLVIYSDNIVR